MAVGNFLRCFHEQGRQKAGRCGPLPPPIRRQPDRSYKGEGGARQDPQPRAPPSHPSSLCLNLHTISMGSRCNSRCGRARFLCLRGVYAGKAKGIFPGASQRRSVRAREGARRTPSLASGPPPRGRGASCSATEEEGTSLSAPLPSVSLPYLAGLAHSLKHRSHVDQTPSREPPSPSIRAPGVPARFVADRRLL